MTTHDEAKLVASCNVIPNRVCLPRLFSSFVMSQDRAPMAGNAMEWRNLDNPNHDLSKEQREKFRK